METVEIFCLALGLMAATNRIEQSMQWLATGSMAEGL
jgi:hypothetical protein